MARTLSPLPFPPFFYPSLPHATDSQLPVSLPSPSPSLPIHQIVRVNAAPAVFSHAKPTGFLLHHADVDPVSVLLSARRGDTGPPCVARLGSGGWDAEDIFAHS